MLSFPTPLRHARTATALAVSLSVLAVPAVSADPPTTAPAFKPGLAPSTGALEYSAASDRKQTPAERRRAKRERLARAHAVRVERQLRDMRRAGDRIARRPYVYGGGHGSFTSRGYDCSGSVSYLLHAAKLLKAPLASGGLMSYGRPGRGKHVTIYANGGHVFMVIDGRRFDTIAHKQSGTRWSSKLVSTRGYVARHPEGL